MALIATSLSRSGQNSEAARDDLEDKDPFTLQSEITRRIFEIQTEFQQRRPELGFIHNLCWFDFKNQFDNPNSSTIKKCEIIFLEIFRYASPFPAVQKFLVLRTLYGLKMEMIRLNYILDRKADNIYENHGMHDDTLLSALKHKILLQTAVEIFANGMSHLSTEDWQKIKDVFEKNYQTFSEPFKTLAQRKVTAKL